MLVYLYDLFFIKFIFFWLLLLSTYILNIINILNPLLSIHMFGCIHLLIVWWLVRWLDFLVILDVEYIRAIIRVVEASHGESVSVESLWKDELNKFEILLVCIGHYAKTQWVSLSFLVHCILIAYSLISCPFSSSFEENASIEAMVHFLLYYSLVRISMIPTYHPLSYF